MNVVSKIVTMHFLSGYDLYCGPSSMTETPCSNKQPEDNNHTLYPAQAFVYEKCRVLFPESLNSITCPH